MADGGSGDEFSLPSIRSDEGLFGAAEESGLRAVISSASDLHNNNDNSTHGRELASVPSHVTSIMQLVLLGMRCRPQSWNLFGTLSFGSAFLETKL